MSLSKVGFWRSTDPYDHNTRGFPQVEHCTDSSWDPTEKLAVLRYLKRKEHRVRRYRGSSECRICGCTNGNTEVSDRTYTWPGGLDHYILEHNVKPRTDFIEYVLGMSDERKEHEPVPRVRRRSR